MTAADRPRADLVALFDTFALLPAGHASLSLFGDEHNAALCAWAAQHGHRVKREPMYSQTQGRWTLLEVRLAGGTISVHLDSVQEQPSCPECDGPADHCADCGVPNGRPHEKFCHQQPEAAGSV